MKQDKNAVLFSVFNYTFFVALAIVMFYPFWHVFMYSLSASVNVKSSGLFLLPRGFTLNAYRFLFDSDTIFNGYRTSLTVVTIGTAISLALTSLTAYPLCRGDLPGRRTIMGGILFTMIFHGGIIPTYVAITSYGLINTVWALILPTSVSVYNLVIMIRFFRGIPESLIDAAYIDGHNDLSIYARIVLPLSKPILATITLFYAVSYWNAFLPGIIYINSMSLQPIQVVLYNMVKVQIVEGDNLMALLREPMKMAVAVLAIIPILMLYPFLQRYFIAGVTAGSIKE
jgi:putative aldouronate transport system permease protein